MTTLPHQRPVTEDLQRAIEQANAAARRLYKAAGARLLGDELQWISGSNGELLNQGQRLDRVSANTVDPPNITEVVTHIYGSVASSRSWKPTATEGAGVQHGRW